MMSDYLQGETIDTACALVALSTTNDILKMMPADDNEINNEIEAVVLVARNLGMEPDADFRRLHRLRRPSRRLDDNPATATSMLSDLTYLRYEFSSLLIPSFQL